MGNCINDTEDNLMFTFLFKNKDVLKLNDEEIDNLIYMFQKVWKVNLILVKEKYFEKSL